MENLIAIANVSEGTFIQRPLTDEEIAADLENQKINSEIEAAKENEKAEAQAKKASAAAKLAALGLDVDDLKALGLG